MKWLESVFKSDQPSADILRRKFEQVEAHSATLPGLPHSTLTAFTSPPRSLKNRYRLILPLSDSRVRLQNGPDDYINASFVDGRRYIATQAPVPRSFVDFWQMVVEQRVPVIVMLVRLQARKANQYWPPDDPDVVMRCGPFELTIVDIQSVFQGLTKRIIKVHDGLVSHIVSHYHYEEWPDHGPPQSCALFKQLHDALLPDLHDQERPIVVHCSAGVGRTGCFITIDHMCRRDLNTCEHDPVGEFVMECRRHRPWFVETEEQYAFIYEYLYWRRINTQ